MSLDFPSSPAVGQTYPSTPVTGVPTYTWDGQKWTTQGAGAIGKTPIFTDGTTAMTAALTLSGDPVNPTDAADKNYVDTRAPPPPFASGTTMMFIQAAAPTGWTRVTTNDDALLRIVGTATPGTGGTNGFVAGYNNVSSTGNFTLATAQCPAMTAGTAFACFSGSPAAAFTNAAGVSIYNNNVTMSNGGGPHSHSVTRNIKYVDALVASKN